jgi:hypothetical protein
MRLETRHHFFPHVKHVGNRNKFVNSPLWFISALAKLRKNLGTAIKVFASKTGKTSQGVS